MTTAQAGVLRNRDFFDSRGFQRGFLLAENLEVESAELSNGLLRIELKRRPQIPDIRQIPITLG